MIIYQPIFQNLPDQFIKNGYRNDAYLRYQKCIDSTKRFCDKIKAEYVSPTEVPKEYEHWRYLEAIKDAMLIHLLSSTPYVFGVDWDIELFDNFTIPNLEEKYMGHDVMCLTYNANDPDYFKPVLRKILDYKGQIDQELSRCWKYLFYHERDNKIQRFDENIYKHYFHE